MLNGTYTVGTTNRETPATPLPKTDITASATIFNANPDRRRLFLQNVGQVVLLVRLAAGAASGTVYDVALKAGSADADGNGGTLDLVGYTGEVRVINASGTGKINGFALTGVQPK